MKCDYFKKCWARSLGVHQEADAGFSLIEIIVAMVIFSLVAAATSLALLNSMAAAHANSMRVQAANVAAAQVDQVRNLGVVQLPEGTEQTQVTVAGRTFDVKRVVAKQQEPTVLRGECNSRLNIPGGAYNSIRVEVTWPGMGTVKPATNDALIAAPVSASALNGIVVQKVHRSDGSPLPGATVTLTPGNFTALTDLYGCAVFDAVPAPPGGMSVVSSATKAGLQASIGQSAATQQFTAAGGAITVAQPLVLGASAQDVRFTLADDVKRNGDQLPFKVAIGMKSGASPAVILEKCAADAKTSCVQKPMLTAPGVSPGKNIPPTNMRFFASACANPQDEAVSVTIPSVQNNQKITLPLQRVRFKLTTDDEYSPVDDMSALEIRLVCHNKDLGHQLLDPVEYDPIDGGVRQLWLAPGEYYARTILDHWTKDCVKFTVGANPVVVRDLVMQWNEIFDCPFQIPGLGEDDD